MLPGHGNLADKFNLPQNFEIAFGQMKTLSRRFQNDQNLLTQYCEIIQSQVTSGIIEEIDNSQLESKNRKHYLPHHPVANYTTQTFY